MSALELSGLWRCFSFSEMRYCVKTHFALKRKHDFWTYLFFIFQTLSDTQEKWSVIISVNSDLVKQVSCTVQALFDGLLATSVFMMLLVFMLPVTICQSSSLTVNHITPGAEVIITNPVHLILIYVLMRFFQGGGTGKCTGFF